MGSDLIPFSSLFLWEALFFWGNKSLDTKCTILWIALNSQKHRICSVLCLLLVVFSFHEHLQSKVTPATPEHDSLKPHTTNTGMHWHCPAFHSGPQIAATMVISQHNFDQKTCAGFKTVENQSQSLLSFTTHLKISPRPLVFWLILNFVTGSNTPLQQFYYIYMSLLVTLKWSIYFQFDSICLKCEQISKYIPFGLSTDSLNLNSGLKMCLCVAVKQKLLLECKWNLFTQLGHIHCYLMSNKHDKPWT